MERQFSYAEQNMLKSAFIYMYLYTRVYIYTHLKKKKQKRKSTLHSLHFSVLPTMEDEAIRNTIQRRPGNGVGEKQKEEGRKGLGKKNGGSHRAGCGLKM